MKKIKFNKNWLIGIVSVLLIVATLGTIATVFVTKSQNKTLSKETLSAVLIGRTGLGKSFGHENTLHYDANITGVESPYGDVTLNSGSGSRWLVVGEEGKNSVLELGKCDYVSNEVIFSSTDSDGERFVFETDFKFSGDDTNSNTHRTSWFSRIRFSDSGGSAINDYYLSNSSNNGSFLYLTDINDDITSCSKIDYDEWYNLRFELVSQKSGDAFDVFVYLDSILVDSYSCVGNLDNIEFVYVTARKDVKDITIRFDNTYTSFE